jgi:multidrug/hemolysin transport system permease protein
MKKFLSLTKRNIKLYFSDKTMFFTSLITPAILLVLYATFLGGIFKDSFIAMIPNELNVSNKIINSLVSGQILSSLLAVSCITVAFTSNLLMVMDKVSGASKDINISPISKSTISLSYFVSSFISTIIVNLVALILCLIYTYTQGWFYKLSDIILLIIDIIILTLFGCALSSVVNFNLNSQGQVSAVGTIVSAGYGFICGAYMPISSFGKTLQKVLLFLPGTYGTSLVRNHSLNSSLNELSNLNVPKKLIDEIKNALDCNLSFFNKNVSQTNMYFIMIISIIVLLVIYILQNKLKKNR